jgi:hypothetical protein
MGKKYKEEKKALIHSIIINLCCFSDSEETPSGAIKLVRMKPCPDLFS